jgi:hypothetical protein
MTRLDLSILTILLVNQFNVGDAFAPIPPMHIDAKVNIKQQKHQNQQPTHVSSSTSSSQLNAGVLIPVPDDFFTVAGISLGFAYTITRSWNRVVVENVAWEKRLEDARMNKLEEDDVSMSSSSSSNNAYTELDLRKIDAEASQSSYGPDAMERRRKSRRRRVRTLDMDDDDDYDDYDDDDDDDMNRRSDDRRYSMTDEQINDFEDKYGVIYDPYYDEPYTVDELPDPADVSFVEDKVYGDRRYQNGEIFYRDENDKNLYWRQGGRPRLKQFWELF